MNITLGRKASGRNTWAGYGALLAGLTMVGALAGVGIWQAVDSGSSTTSVAEPAVVRPITPAAFKPVPTHVYLVDSQAMGDAIVQADFETQMSGGYAGDFHNTRIIDVSTPEGREQAWLLNAELAQVAMEDPAYDASLVQIHDLTVASAGAGSFSGSVARPFVPEETSAVPTYFYVVESKAQGDAILLADNQTQLELLESDSMLNHRVVIIDVSTPEGARLLETVNAQLFEFWGDPSVDQSLIQVIDARK